MNPRMLAITFLLVAPLIALAKDEGWPKQFEKKGWVIVMYQPQPDSLKDVDLKARMAISATNKKESQGPIFGSVWITAKLDIDRDDRTVEIDKVKVEKVKFPNITPEQEKKLIDLLEDEIPDLDLEISLDRLLAAIDQTQFQQKSAEALKNDPPKIIVKTEPAILITIDGNPRTQKIKDTELERVYNTTFPIVYDPDDKEYFFYGTSVWFTTEDLISGEWEYIKHPPSEVEDLFKEKDGSQPKPPADEPAVSPDELKKAKIVVSTVPAELIVTVGEPNLAPIAGDELMYVTNTESDVFMDINLQKYFLLISGRWFSSPSLKEGPWTWVPGDSLPKVFAQITEQGPKGEVLAHVPGTPQATEAYYDAQMPQTAAIKRSEAKLEVTYDGEPQFKPIEGTSMLYAVNTPVQVLCISGQYFACDQGVWFVSPGAKGPWTVSDKRPAQVDSIPPQSPVYNVKYVYVYDSTPEVVYVGYTPAYMGCYAYGGVVVYGTGYYYPPYVSPYVYYPHPVTYGVAVHYNPYTGWSMGMSWGIGVAMTRGWAGYGHGYSHGYNAGFWAGYHAGNYHGGAYGPGGYNPRQPYNRGSAGARPSTQPAGGARPSAQPAGGARPSTQPARGSNLYSRPENKARTSPSTQPANRQAPKTAKGASNNMYSDRNGDVYRKSNDGWSNANSRPSQQPSASNRSSSPSSLDRDAQSRQRGAQRSQGYQSSGSRGGGGGRRR
jgi:hypothetical protein